MGRLQIGFSRLDITPPLGTHMAGYYEQRLAEGILDPLEVNAVAVSDGERTAVLFSCDLIGVCQELMDSYRRRVAADNGLEAEAVFIACTHTHTGPCVGRNEEDDPSYDGLLGRKLSDAARLALADLRPASLSVGRGEVEGVSFVRRFRMKDGSIRTNPGVGNPEIQAPIGTPDTAVQLVRAAREGADEIVIVNFQVHPDTIGGCRFSADYPRFVRETVEGALPGVKCIYFNGAQGDTNHIDVVDGAKPRFGLVDDRSRAYRNARFMGQAIAGAALQLYGKTDALAADRVCFGQSLIPIPSSRVDASRIPDAERILELHNAGRDDEIPFEGMERVTVIAEATRMKLLEHGPDAFSLRISAVGIAGPEGGVAFAGIPGEPFTDIGRGIKSRSPFSMTIPCCLTNGSEGYFPMKQAYDEGGYEARSSRFRPGVAEKLTDAAVRLLETLR